MVTLSICILFCDKDKHCVPNILNNIKEKCHLNYEIILVDNRGDRSEEIKLPENLPIKLVKSRGLGQWNGRRSAIEASSGKYIWFVDVDDSICDVPMWIEDELQGHIDILNFNAKDSFGELTGTWPLRKPEDRSRLINQKPNLLDLDIEIMTGPCVWNKFFRRNVLLPSLNYNDEYLTYNEDSLFNMIALKYSTTWKSLDICLYNYNSEDSQAASTHLSSFSKFENLISSGQNLFKIRDQIFTSEIEKKATYDWISPELCVQFFNGRIYHSVPSLQIREMKLLCKTYGASFVKQNIEKHAICELEKTGKTRAQIVDELLEIWEEATENKSLAICFNFCDKDFKYVPDLIQNIKDNIRLRNYEIIACDNRTRDNGKDEYINDVKIWPCGGNTGPLGGRKEACKHITADYVWYIDADDYINAVIGRAEQKILNKNYDYVSFKAIDDTGRISGIWADTTLYNNKEINNNDGHFFSYRTYLMTGAALWNKWVKTDVFKCILDIPDTTAVCYEDALCNSYIMKHSNRMFLYNMPLYYYRSNIGDANRQNIQELESFKRTTNGGRTSLDIAKQIFTEKELFIMDAWFSDLRYIEFTLKRVVDSVDEIQTDEFKEMLKYFSEQDILTGFKYFTWYFNSKQVFNSFQKFKKLTNISDKVESTKTPLLSISIAFCDKDIQCIHELLYTIREYVHVDYEIILINNCQYNNKFIPMLNGIRVIASGSTPENNKGTFFTRKLGVENAKGKYIWFIDADDMIISSLNNKEKVLLNKDYDMIVFNSRKKHGGATGMGQTFTTSQEIKRSSLLYNEFYQQTGPCLWNKWIKTEKLRGILNTSNKAVNAFEDTLVSSFAEKNSTSAFFFPKTIYEYNCEDNTCSEKISSQMLNKIFLGKDDINSLKQELFTPAEIMSVYHLSQKYSDDFFATRQQRQLDLSTSDRICILSRTPIVTDFAVFSPNENLKSIEQFSYILLNLNNAKLQNIQITELYNMCFQECQTLDPKTLLQFNFLVKVEDFLKVIKGSSIKVRANVKNKIF